MIRARDYSAGTRAALVALSKGTCYFPGCTSPVIRFLDGEPFVNYEIAHIRDANQGNRYESNMTDDERRAFTNLVLLCKPHHTLVDKTHPERFSKEDLESWKRDREGDGLEALAGLSGLTEERLEELIVDAVAAVPSLDGQAVVGVAKSAATLATTVRESRRAVEAQVRHWRTTWEAARASFFAWDPKTGERIYAEPSRVETQRHQQAVSAALRDAASLVSTPAAETVHELAAVRATAVPLRPWADAVARAVEAVLAAAARWPAPPPFQDDSRLEGALAQLSETVDSLTAKWRGEAVAEPQVPEAPQEPQEPEAARRLREHGELLEPARRFLRAAELPFDPELFDRLLDATQVAATLPPVLSLYPYGLDATAGLIAAVARHAKDESFSEVLDWCEGAGVVRGLFVARHLASDARRHGQEARVRKAAGVARALLGAVDWSDTAVWETVEVYGRDVLAIDAAIASAGATAFRLEDALQRSPDILSNLVRSCASWVERADGWDAPKLLGWGRTYRELPPWFPTTAVVNALREAFPHVTPEEESASGSDETEALAAEILYRAMEDRSEPQR